MDTILDNMSTWIVGKIFSLVISLAGYIFTPPQYDVFKEPVVKAIWSMLQTGALVILGLKITYDIIKLYILRAHGNSELDIGSFFIRMAISVATIFSLPWMVEKLWNIGLEVSQAIVSASKTSLSPSDYLESLQNSAASGSVVGISNPDPIIALVMAMIASVVILLIGIFIYIQSLKRFFELAVVVCVGIWQMIFYTQNPNAMQSFWKDLVTLCFTQSIQMFIMNLGLIILATQGTQSTNSFFGLAMYLASLIAAWKAPGMISKYTASTGTGQMMGGITQTIVSKIPFGKK